MAFLSINAIPEPGYNSWRDNKGWQIATWDPEKTLPAIKDARHTADVVIVMVHWGYEYETKYSLLQKDAAQKMVDAGAAVIVGSHPHVIQETAVIRSSVDEQRLSFVAYSLGNFLFDQFIEPTNHGLALHIFIDKTGLRGVRPRLVKAGTSPEFISNKAAEILLTRNKPKPETLEFDCSHIICRSVLTRREFGDNQFVHGEIDLTGDGIPEQVWLKNGRVSIFEKGNCVWESPPEWQVLDVALGDPNLDGRGEVVLALQKSDKNGTIRSHPFLIGFRGGIYRQVWGGSAVKNPILEIEVGDIDGDRDQELIVLEQNENGRDRSIVVWRYNSWFFNPVWRSLPGEYENLRIIALEGSSKMRIIVTRPW